MESQIFTWDGWDELDTMAFAFSDAVLVVDVGPYKVGQKFAYVNVDYENGEMKFHMQGSDEPVMTCKMELQLKVQSYKLVRSL